MVQDAPCDAASLQALLRRGAEFGQTYTTDEGQSEALILSDEARQTLAWIEALGEGRRRFCQRMVCSSPAAVLG